MPGKPHFDHDLFFFLTQLKVHNERSWFNENKPRYESAMKRPMLAFLADLAAPLKRVNPAYQPDLRPVGGSLFRIYRDTRFSRDKTPYKTHLAAQIRHRAATGDVHAPGFYLHLEPGGSFFSAGIWGPEPAHLKAIRDRIMARPQEWKACLKKGLDLYQEDAYKRPPKGIDPGHPLIGHLKLRHFLVSSDLSEREVLAPGFLQRVVREARRMNPFLEFLNRSIGLKG